jgi:hypothetical protein
MVCRDGTCIDAASPSHVITMCPMKAIPMWYEPSVPHLGAAMPNDTSPPESDELEQHHREGWQGWHMY